MKIEEVRMKSGFVFEREIGYGNPIVPKSLAFSIRIAKFHKILLTRSKEYEAIFKQLIRCGAFVGVSSISHNQKRFC